MWEEKIKKAYAFSIIKSIKNANKLITKLTPNTISKILANFVFSPLSLCGISYATPSKIIIPFYLGILQLLDIHYNTFPMFV